MKIVFLILMILGFTTISNHAFGLDYEFAYDEYKPGGSMTQYHDMKKLNFTILEVKKIFIPKWIVEPGDYSDILKIKFNVTNNGLEYFSVYKNMFRIDVIDPGHGLQEARTNRDNMVDNYYPQYVEDFKLRFQDVSLPSELSDCVLLNHNIKINQTKTLSVCFDVRQKWSREPLNLTGPRQYYLTMMDNKFAYSCPNCISVLLNDYYQNPMMEKNLTPKTQISLGISKDKVSCKEGFEMVFKNLHSPVCVRPETANKLIQRGWMKET